MDETKPTKAPKQFIRLLKKAMAEHPEKLSLNAVTRRAGISPAYLFFLLHGQRGAPSNAVIDRLEATLNIPNGELHKAAGKPDAKVLAFFRKATGGSIVRALAVLPDKQLVAIHKLIENFVQQQNHSEGK